MSLADLNQGENVRESTVEKKAKEYAESQGGQFIKFMSGMNGFPDRIVLFEGGCIGFLELKRPGKRPEKLQTHWITVLDRMGFTAGWADSVESAQSFIDQVQRSK